MLDTVCVHVWWAQCVCMCAVCVVTVGRLEEAHEAFTDGLPAGACIVLHFSGHGCEEDGKNYLVPIDGRTSTAAGG